MGSGGRSWWWSCGVGTCGGSAGEGAGREVVVVAMQRKILIGTCRETKKKKQNTNLVVNI